MATVKRKLFPCPYNIACKCDMQYPCYGCEEFKPKEIILPDDYLPSTVHTFLSDKFKSILLSEGVIDKITEQGGSIIVIFKNKRAYRFSLQLCNDSFCYDSDASEIRIHIGGNLDKIACDKCGCRPNTIYATREGNFCEKCKPKDIL